MSDKESIARLRIELSGIHPTIWRRVEVPLSTSLKILHEIIQAAMPFDDTHLYEFMVAGRRYGVPDPEWDYDPPVRAAKSIRIGTLIDQEIKALSYTYDFGDDWQHMIIVESVSDADPTHEYPRFIDGERRAPPEDVGGIPGFAAFLEAMAKPRHAQHRQMMQWYGGPFPADDIDEPRIRQKMQKLSRRRIIGKAAYKKSIGRQN